MKFPVLEFFPRLLLCAQQKSFKRQNFQFMQALDNTLPAEPIQERWGEALNAGFLVAPVALLRHQQELGLDAGDLVVALNILGAWWYRDRLPFPSTNTIASRMGVTMRTVQRHLAKLEGLGLIRRLRNQPGSGNGVLVTKYDPDGLVKRLQALGKEAHPRRKLREAPTDGAQQEKSNEFAT